MRSLFKFNKSLKTHHLATCIEFNNVEKASNDNHWKQYRYDNKLLFPPYFPVQAV